MFRSPCDEVEDSTRRKRKRRTADGELARENAFMLSSVAEALQAAALARSDSQVF